MGQISATQNAADRAQRGERLDSHLFQSLVDGLIAAEEPFVVQPQPHPLDDIFKFRRGAEGKSRGRRDCLSHHAGSSGVCRATYLYSHARAGPSEAQIDSGSSPSQNRFTVLNLFWARFLFINTSLVKVWCS